MRRPVAACWLCPWMRSLGRTAREVQAVRAVARAHCTTTRHPVEIICDRGRGVYSLMRGRVLFERRRSPHAIEARS